MRFSNHSIKDICLCQSLSEGDGQDVMSDQEYKKMICDEAGRLLFRRGRQKVHKEKRRKKERIRIKKTRQGSKRARKRKKE